MKALITGASGFVGRHLAVELRSYGYSVTGMDLVANHQETRIANILDKQAVFSLVQDVAPDCIFHLAAQASVAYSWKNPQLTFEVNVNGTLNLLDAVRSTNPDIRIVIIGTSDQYGLVKPENCPISETFPINPVSPYAISKQAQESLVKTYVQNYSMDIVMTRSFNHFGPGQSKGFVVSDFASAVAEIERGSTPVISVGNLDAIRDFTDVRDVVRAYRLLGETGHSGEIYNVGSGNVHSIREVLDNLVRLSDAKIEIRPNPDKMRPSDLPFVQCDNSKLRQQTGWTPLVPFEKSLYDTLQSWKTLPDRQGKP